MAGLAGGVGLNLWLWAAQPGVHWMWWNVTGFALTALIGFASGLAASRVRAIAVEYTLLNQGIFKKERGWLWAHGALAIYFLLMLAIVCWL